MNSSSNNFIKITNDSTIIDKKYGITEQVRYQLQKAYDMAMNAKVKDIKKIQDLIISYPEVPHFKNYLTVLYDGLGQKENAHDLTLQITLKHPDYLFGKLNLASKLLDEGKYDLIPGVLGKELELAALYPDRDTFHISEITSYYLLLARYYLKLDDLEVAEQCYDYLNEIAPDADATKQVFALLNICRFTKNGARMEEEEKLNINVNVKSQAENSKASEPPVFVHKDMEVLYQYDMRIEKALLHNILTLPRQSLIADLELILRDSIARFKHFDALYEQEDVDAKTDFVIHALYLLGELKAAESLPVVFEVLSQHDEYYNLYFGDWIHDEMWEPIYKMNNTDLDGYKTFMLLPNKYTYAKNVVVVLLEQIVAHQPQRKEEVVACFKHILIEYNKCSVTDNIIDSDLIAYMACSVTNIVGTEAEEQLKPLFEKGWVSREVCGTYEELIKTPGKLNTHELMSLDARYDQIASLWYDNNSSWPSIPSMTNELNTSHNLSQTIVGEKKVGRNDPCTCGSGKKYKKCCLNN